MGESSRSAANYRERLPNDLRNHRDWRTYKGGVLNPVRNQPRNCNMCWAIVTAEVVSAVVNIKRKAEGLNSIECSSQELLDCCEEEIIECYLYSIPKALKWIMNHGIRTKDKYPDKKFKCHCRAKTAEEKLTAVRIKDFAKVDFTDEADFLKHVDRQPVAGGVILTDEFANLKDNIYMGSDTPMLYFKVLENGEKDKEGKIMKHAILVVGFGYDEKQGKNFWLVKNSYGEKWGVEGYGRIARDSSLSAGGRVNLRRQLIFSTYVPIL